MDLLSPGFLLHLRQGVIARKLSQLCRNDIGEPSETIATITYLLVNT